MSEFFRRMNARRREAFDTECWNLWKRGYSKEYISHRTGATVYEVEGAIRRVECGRYGSEEGGRK